MRIDNIKTTLVTAAITLSLAIPSAAMAYDDGDAIMACKSRLRDEYKLTDFRHMSGEALPGAGHKFKVEGETKIDGKKYPISCEVTDRHVTSVSYDGPKEKELSDAQKVAAGVAAVAAVAAIASAVNKDDSAGKAEVSDLVGMRAGSGEKELEDRGYTFVSSSKDSDRVYSNWWSPKADKCITVVTMEGRYDSITDTLPADCDRD